MNPTDPTTWTIARARKALDDGETSALDLARAFLDRAAALEPSIHALLERTTDRALSDAKARHLVRNPKRGEWEAD